MSKRWPKRQEKQFLKRVWGVIGNTCLFFGVIFFWAHFTVFNAKVFEFSNLTCASWERNKRTLPIECFSCWIIWTSLELFVLVGLRNQPTLATLSLLSPPNDVWETSVEIPYRWRVTTRIWVVLLIGWVKFPKRHDQSEALPRTG